MIVKTLSNRNSAMEGSNFEAKGVFVEKNNGTAHIIFSLIRTLDILC